MLLGSLASFEGAEVAALAGLGVRFAGVEAIFAGFEFADHGDLYFVEDVPCMTISGIAVIVCRARNEPTPGESVTQISEPAATPQDRLLTARSVSMAESLVDKGFGGAGFEDDESGRNISGIIIARRAWR